MSKDASSSRRTRWQMTLQSTIALESAVVAHVLDCILLLSADLDLPIFHRWLWIWVLLSTIRWPSDTSSLAGLKVVEDENWKSQIKEQDDTTTKWRNQVRQLKCSSRHLRLSNYNALCIHLALEAKHHQLESFHQPLSDFLSTQRILKTQQLLDILTRVRSDQNQVEPLNTVERFDHRAFHILTECLFDEGIMGARYCALPECGDLQEGLKDFQSSRICA